MAFDDLSALMAAVRETIAIVDRLPITNEERERIYWKNAAELLKVNYV